MFTLKTLSRYRVMRASACALGLVILAAANPGRSQEANNATAAPAVGYANQGWSATERATFYTTSQGSHLMPYAWFKALRRLDADEPFGGDQLQRYGYLFNDSPTNVNGLPVGFVIDGRAQSGQLGMTCAACHTGQMDYVKDGQVKSLRLDGAPASADFQQFLTDLRDTTRATLANADRFNDFAKTVLGKNASPEATAQLKSDFGAWVKQFGDFMDASLPQTPWGPGRLDAFGMIFNRVAARDLAVHDNFKVADAPVSYPFLWNAPKQDHTQWTGSVPNGLFVQGLARNTGEVFGVFADFKPAIRIPGTLLTPTVINYTSNSADFAGLQTLEELIVKLQSPAWPADLPPIDRPLAASGETLFVANCGGCHGVKPSPLLIDAWATPTQAVGTDPKMALNAARLSDPGLYTGALLPPRLIPGRFSYPAKTTDILARSVLGAIRDEALLPVPITPDKLATSGVWRAIRQDLARLKPAEAAGLAHPANVLSAQLRLAKGLDALIKTRLANLFTTRPVDASGAAYEARVLKGIWATAPYLHNGSVPNLWELLLPAKQRQPSFMVGSRVFDPKNVGYDVVASPSKNGTFVTDPKNANGNGNGGHEYGTNLTEAQRWAIIEYLKTL